MFQKIFGQRDGFPGRSLTPILQLRRENDQIIPVVLCFKAKFLCSDVLGCSLKVKPLITGKGNVKAACPAAVIFIRDENAVMDIAIFMGMQYAVHHKIPVVHHRTQAYPLYQKKYHNKSSVVASLRL